jgi:hypothetical protein
VAPDPNHWILVADNVTYGDTIDSYNNALGFTNIPIPYGDSAESKVVFQVPRYTKYGYIKHNGPFTWDPIFAPIDHYNTHSS